MREARQSTQPQNGHNRNDKPETKKSSTCQMLWGLVIIASSDAYSMHHISSRVQVFLRRQ